MNRKIAYIWIFLILIGFISTDFIFDYFILISIWSGIFILGSTSIIKYCWKQSRALSIYWISIIAVTLIISGIQYYSIDQLSPILPFNHISTIFMITLGISFILTSVFSRIIFFAPIGFILLIISLPLDKFKMNYPATAYGIILSSALIGYLILSHYTPYDKTIVGPKFAEANGFAEEEFDHMHKFKCTNCGYIYEGYKKLNDCPRCMAGADLLVDVD